jgi:DNA-binding MarR family transcriptional regulator
MAKLVGEDYQALSQFRYLIRKFLITGDVAANSAGLNSQQYVLLLHIRSFGNSQEPTIRNLAERLLIKHQSVVGLIDRTEKRGLIFRKKSIKDRRNVLIFLTAKGGMILEKIAKERFKELDKSGPELIGALKRIISKNNL